MILRSKNSYLSLKKPFCLLVLIIIIFPSSSGITNLKRSSITVPNEMNKNYEYSLTLNSSFNQLTFEIWGYHNASFSVTIQNHQNSSYPIGIIWQYPKLIQNQIIESVVINTSLIPNITFSDNLTMVNSYIDTYPQESNLAIKLYNSSSYNPNDTSYITVSFYRTFEGISKNNEPGSDQGFILITWSVYAIPVVIFLFLVIKSVLSKRK